MRFDPSAANATLIQSGTWCQAEIVAAEERLSKNGNEMIQTDFQIYDSIGIHPVITHYFVATQPGFLKKLCTALDIDFSTGEIKAGSLVGRTAWVLIKIQEDKTGQFPDKNVLAAFSKTKPDGAAAPQPRITQSTESQDSDIPF